MQFIYMNPPQGTERTYDDPPRRPDNDLYNDTIVMNEMLQSESVQPHVYSRTNSLRQRRTEGHNRTWTVFLYSFFAFNVVCTLGWLCNMYNGHGSSSNSSRVPPAWAPDMEPRYTFAMWQREVLLWTVANSDLEPHRQAALVLQQLRGGARELTRDLPVNVILNGAQLNGVQVDGMTYIMSVLAERYGQLGEELRLKVVKEFMDFDRKASESIDDLLTRFEIVRHRATDTGNFQMSFEGIAYMLLRACRVNDQQFLMLTQPTGGRLPNNEPEYRNLFGALRRLGHVIEHRPDNIAAGLRGNGQGGRGFSRNYLTNEPQENEEPEANSTSAYP